LCISIVRCCWRGLSLLYYTTFIPCLPSSILFQTLVLRIENDHNIRITLLFQTVPHTILLAPPLVFDTALSDVPKHFRLKRPNRLTHVWLLNSHFRTPKATTTQPLSRMLQMQLFGRAATVVLVPVVSGPAGGHTVLP